MLFMHRRYNMQQIRQWWHRWLAWWRPPPERTVQISLQRLQARMDTLEQIVLTHHLPVPAGTVPGPPTLADPPLEDLPDAHLGAY